MQTSWLERLTALLLRRKTASLTQNEVQNLNDISEQAGKPQTNDILTKIREGGSMILMRAANSACGGQHSARGRDLDVDTWMVG